MKPLRAPHFLRVAQSLALVSGFGPVAVVVGAGVLGCSSSTPGIQACPDAACGVTDAAVRFDGFVTGVVANPEAGGGIQIPPGDAGPDAPLVGGPLLPPELPA